MKKHYLILMLASLSTMLVQSQSIQFLEANNVRAGIGTGGGLFCKLDTLGNTANDTTFGLFEAPKGSGIYAIYAASMGIAGLDAANNLHCSAQRYMPNDFFNGPLGITYNQLYRNYFNRVFKVKAAQLNALINIPIPRAISQIPAEVLLWPAKGNSYVQSYYGVNITDDLAPFIDWDMDGVYEPVLGDIPAICGAEAIFFVFNDVNGPQDDSTGLNLGIEVRGMVEVYDAPVFGPQANYGKLAVNNAVFVHYEIENKSATSYHNCYTALYEDMDLGCYQNDYIGCDTTKNLMYGYNGNTDVNCSAQTLGYNERIVAHGSKLLNSKLASFTYQNNMGVNSEPDNASEFYNYMQGLWKDGAPYRYGGDGLTTTNATVVKHLYPGNPNVPNEWSEVNTQEGPSSAPSDRRWHGSIGPYNLAAGETKEMDMVYFISYDTATSSGITNYTIVDTLLRDADILQQYYNNGILPCRAAQQTVGISETQKIQVNVFPNPSNSVLNIQCENTITALQLSDLVGKQVLVQMLNSNTAVLDVSKLAKGIYLLQLSSGTQTATRKVVIN